MTCSLDAQIEIIVCFMWGNCAVMADYHRLTSVNEKPTHRPGVQDPQKLIFYK